MRNHRVLSVRQPWAWAIVAGHKDVENRTWSTPQRGRILIHAPRTIAHDDEDFVFRLVRRLQPNRLPFVVEREYRDALALGAIVGAVDVADVVRDSDSPWFFGPVGWLLANAQRFNTPIPTRGRLGLWTWTGDVPELAA